MRRQLDKTTKIIITGSCILITIALLLWEYTHDGVIVHYVMRSDTMPGLSNWWGLISIPIVSWLCVSLIRYEEAIEKRTALVQNAARASSTLILGLLISYFFITNSESLMPVYLTFLLVVLSFFIPLYKTEYLLGYILGTMFTFGTIIPVVAGCILWSLFYLFYKIPRKIVRLVTQKNNQ